VFSVPLSVFETDSSHGRMRGSRDAPRPSFMRACVPNMLEAHIIFVQAKQFLSSSSNLIEVPLPVKRSTNGNEWASEQTRRD
jgi:hypothetical protein